MLVLAIDTCDVRGSVALLIDGKLVDTVVHGDDSGYSAWLLPAVDRTLKTASKRLSDVDLFAVATGPGSFTGVRIGLTTVKAWSEVFGKPIAPVSRLKVLAHESPMGGLFVASFIIAQRTEIFGAFYRREGRELKLIGEESVGSPEDFLARVAEQSTEAKVSWVSTDASALSSVAKVASAPGVSGEYKFWAARMDRGEEILGVPCVLAPLVGRLGYEKALKGETVDALGLDANYVRRSYVEVFQKGAAPGPSK